MGTAKDNNLMMFEYIKERLDAMDDKLGKLPCTAHIDRLARIETKVENLNDIRKLVLSTVVRWILPALLGGGGLVAIIFK